MASAGGAEMTGSLEREFEQAMINSAEQAVAIGYNPKRFNLMVRRDGGLATAQKLLHSSVVSDGYIILWEKQRLDLSLEALVLQAKWRALFTDEELEIARQRLVSYGYLRDS